MRKTVGRSSKINCFQHLMCKLSNCEKVELMKRHLFPFVKLYENYLQIIVEIWTGKFI